MGKFCPALCQPDPGLGERHWNHWFTAGQEGNSGSEVLFSVLCYTIDSEQSSPKLRFCLT